MLTVRSSVQSVRLRDNPNCSRAVLIRVLGHLENNLIRYIVLSGNDS